MGYPLHPSWHSPCCPPSVSFQAYPEYEVFMGDLVSALDQLLDVPPVDTAALGQGSLLQRLRSLRALQPLLQAGTSGMLGSPDGNRCLPAPGVCDAELPLPGAQAPQEPQLGWQVLAGLPALVPPNPARHRQPSGHSHAVSHHLSIPRAGAGAAAAPLL